jgi:hypothetical protein
MLASGGRLVLNVPGPTPPLFGTLADALARHIHRDAASFVHVVFSLHDARELRGLIESAGCAAVNVQRKSKTLRLPAPVDFLWQYVHSTPLAGALDKASPQARDALQREVCAQWERVVVDGGLTLELGVTTAIAGLAAG